MDLTEARSLLGQVRDAIPTGQWGAKVTTEGDDWPGNVRELEAVVKQAMVCRREGSGRGVRYVPATRTP